MIKYHTGQKFLTKKGDYVYLDRIQGNYLFLKYKGKIYKRHESIIGEKLYLNKDHFIKSNRRIQEKNIHKKDEKKQAKEILNDKDNKIKEINYLCKNCIFLKKNVCRGTIEGCGNYKNYKLTDEKYIFNYNLEPSQIAKKIYSKNISKKNKKKDDVKKVKTSYACTKCKKCILYKREDCSGRKTACESFRYCPIMTDEDRKNYPKEGDASYMRRTGFSRNR